MVDSDVLSHDAPPNGGWAAALAELRTSADVARAAGGPSPTLIVRLAEGDEVKIEDAVMGAVFSMVVGFRGLYAWCDAWTLQTFLRVNSALGPLGGMGVAGLEVNFRGGSDEELAAIPPPLLAAEAAAGAAQPRTLAAFTAAARRNGIRLFMSVNFEPGGPVYYYARATPEQRAVMEQEYSDAIDNF